MTERMGRAADPQAVAEDRRKAETIARRHVKAVQTVLGTPEGRIVLWQIIEQARAHWQESGPIFDLTQANYDRGKRDLGLSIIDTCAAASPEGFRLMRDEAEAAQREMQV
jgi:hypothetical protein